MAVHTHLAIPQPEALRRLANRFAVFQQAADGPSLRYMRHWIETGHARLAKPLAEADQQAFDQLDAALNEPRFCHALRLEPGDLLFCDNHKTAHDREAYRDDPAAPRLMVRLWLKDRPRGHVAP